MARGASASCARSRWSCRRPSIRTRPPHGSRRSLRDAERRRWRPLAAVAIGAALAAVVALEIVGHVTGASPKPPTLLRLDPASGRIVSSVHDAQLGCGPCGPNLWVSNGTLWERTGADGSTIAIRDLTSGKVERTLAVPPGTAGAHRRLRRRVGREPRHRDLKRPAGGHGRADRRAERPRCGERARPRRPPQRCDRGLQ